jgi:hypothetical protein
MYGVPQWVVVCKGDLSLADRKGLWFVSAGAESSGRPQVPAAAWSWGAPARYHGGSRRQELLRGSFPQRGNTEWDGSSCAVVGGCWILWSGDGAEGGARKKNAEGLFWHVLACSAGPPATPPQHGVKRRAPFEAMRVWRGAKRSAAQRWPGARSEAAQAGRNGRCGPLRWPRGPQRGRRQRPTGDRKLESRGAPAPYRQGARPEPKRGAPRSGHGPVLFGP